jgi:hypothetical protein
MSIPLTRSTAIVMALASIMLMACGPDEDASLATHSDTAQNASAAPALPAATGNLATAAAPNDPSTMSTSSTANAPGISGALSMSGTPGTLGANASAQPAVTVDSAVLSAQASLAADSRQVTPVMSEAPTDSGNASGNP